MIAEEQDIISKLVPLINIIKDRESLYFEALNFANKNIQSSFNDFDQIYIFNKFLTLATGQENLLINNEEQLLTELGSAELEKSQTLKINNKSKQMMRLNTRVLEMIDEAVERASKSLFGDNGRLSINYSRFKKSLHKILKQSLIDPYDFARVFINFSKTKYQKQITRLKKYLSRLEVGDQVNFREMFVLKQGSDISSSPQQKIKLKSIQKLTKKINLKDRNQEVQASQRKPSSKKPINSRPKPKRSLLQKAMIKKQQEKINQKTKDTFATVEKTQKEKKPAKQRNIKQLYKHYSVMELNKKEFLEDFIFEKDNEEEKRRELMDFLMEKNKLNEEQIKNYHTQSQHFTPDASLLLPSPKSDDHINCFAQNQFYGVSRSSFRASLIKSRRKPNYLIEPPTEFSEGDAYNNQISKTTRNFSSRKPNTSFLSPSPQPTNRVRNIHRSKKILVVKPQIVFKNDIIPKAQIINNTQWIQNPLTGPKDNRLARRSEPIRLKRRNQPYPLDSPFLPEQFQFTLYPL